MNIIDHLSLGVPSIAEGRAFYDPVMAALGYDCLAANDGFAAYGKGAVQFLLMKPANGKTFTQGNGTHVAFVGESPEAVSAFHAAAVKAGATDEGAPGPRPDYPVPGVFAAFARDPFGHRLEAIHAGFAA